MNYAPKLTVAVCENFFPEASAVHALGKLTDIDLLSWTARCEQPISSWSDITERLPDLNRDQPLLIIGGCLPRHLPEPPADFPPTRFHQLDHCFDMLIGTTMAASLIGEKAYMASSGWLQNWPDHLHSWGFDKNSAQLFFQDSAAKIVHLDSGILSNSEALLASFAAYVQLPASRIMVGLDFMTMLLIKLTKEWQNSLLNSSLKQCKEQAANYALSLSLLDELADKNREQEAISGIINIFQVLFAPEMVIFHPTPDDTAEQDSSNPPSGLTVQEQQQLDNEGFLSRTAEAGFWLSLKNTQLHLGYLEIRKVAFPNHLDRYLNLALSIAPLCTLAINKARFAEALQQEVDALRNILPLCSYCKKIRDKEGDWQEVDVYIQENSTVDISHSLCPDCAQKHYPDQYARMQKNSDNN